MSQLVLLKSPHASQKPLLSLEERQIFLRESIDLFSGNRQGHLIHRCYLTPEALFFGGKFSSISANYMKPAELSVIPVVAKAINENFAHAHGFIGVENGPGMESAMRSKSIPFFSRLNNLHTWVGRDVSSVSIEIMPKIMREGLPNVLIIPDMSDFLEEDYPSHLGDGRKVVAEFGMTRGNMEGFSEDGFPYHTIKSDFLKHRARMNQGDIYTFTFDCNQNGAEVEAAYNSEWTTLWGRELFKVMKSELSIEGDFDPESYDFRCIFNAKSHGGFNYMIAARSMEFSIGGKVFKVDKDQGFGITNSFKMPIEIAEKLVKDTGFKIDWHYGHDRRVAMPTFTAI